ncbi:hypothetical protein QBC32DRAFT_224256 [Pseudoneurospora amorphoporcata]|uniref:Enoyl reductase (ER) domain-containing protein n=1 Tax=Pseudoneurospora amorphoporcata TaxID=241081 RepID=A0AAN6NKA9_9PEZI|nr:hypothetical protein QBC32DRAFT_224256 [Pseudoneurospora amorphoporcata]
MDSSPSAPTNLPLTQRNQFISRLLAVQSCPSGPPYTSSLQISRDHQYPIPGPNEVCIRSRAVGLNHIDWKNLEHEIMVKQWPEILGFEVAGVVEMVGMDVKDSELRVGLAVLGLSGPVGMRGGPPGKGGPEGPGGPGDKTIEKHEEQGMWVGRAGGFQDVTCVHKSMVTRKPANWNFAWAAGAPLVYITACSAIVCGLGIQLPFLANNTKPSLDSTTSLLHLESLNINDDFKRTSAVNKLRVKSVLVLGGSSGVGGAAIQLLRLALGPKAVIITITNNKNYYRELRDRGATAHLSGQYEGLVEKVRFLTGGKGVDAIVDCISGAACLELPPIPQSPTPSADYDPDTDKISIKKEPGLDEAAIEDIPEFQPVTFWDVFRKDGPKLYAEVATGRKVNVPTDRGIQAKLVFSKMILSTPGGERALKALPALVEAGKFVFPHPGGVKVVGKGLESIATGLAELREGSGGVKFVVEV